MGRILKSYIMPHPPIVVNEVGKGSEGGALATIKALERAAGEIAEIAPDTIIVTTPHGPVFADYIYISVSERLKGSFDKFGAPDVRFEFQNDLKLVNTIIDKASVEGIPCGGLEESLVRRYKVSRQLDHGALVPLYFISQKYSDFKLIHISTAFLPPTDLYRFGMSIAEAVSEADRKVVFVASGDLSHKLSEEGPYGYNDKGPLFDKLLVESVEAGNIDTLLEMDENLCEGAGECGLRSFLMMFGALEGRQLHPEIYSYEGPFGVGYAVAGIDTGDEASQENTVERVLKKSRMKMQEIRDSESPFTELARSALETYVKTGRVISVPANLPPDFLFKKAGTFVSIKKYGRLRGCIGTTGPTRENIAQEIIYNAISSGIRDPRFDEVEEAELDDLVYSVDVLSESEPVRSIQELDTERYGVIVRKGGRSGLLLPNLEGIDTPEQQISIALQKAGINPDEDYDMERFEVVRYK